MQENIPKTVSGDPEVSPRPAREIDVTIESLAYGGEGVAHTPRALFVPGAAPGDRLRVRLLEEKERWARGKLIAVLEPAACRREPPCPLASTCGGCPWQHVTEEAQREAKRRAVQDTLRRIGRIAGVEVPPVMHAGPAFGYRRRTRLQVSWPEGRLRLGFHAPASHEVVDAPECLQMSPGLQVAHAALREALRAGPALKGLGSVEIAVGSDDGPGVATFRISGRMHRATRQGIGRVVHAVVEMGPLAGVALLGAGDQVIAKWGDLTIAHRYPAGVLPGAPFTLRQRAWSFSQAGWDANLLLIRTVIAALGDPPPVRLLELYAGSGNFTLPLAALGIRMYAAERDQGAAEDLSRNLAQAGLAAKVVAASAKTALERAGDLDAVLLDPPRSGAAEAMPALTALAPPRIVYVACNPATLARDLARLVKRGYRVHDVKAIDLYPQTYHVECVVTCILEEG